MNTGRINRWYQLRPIVATSLRYCSNVNNPDGEDTTWRIVYLDILELSNINIVTGFNFRRGARRLRVMVMKIEGAPAREWD